ncbi:hypothetical protein ACFL3B_00735 [Gemmatimonadota bacterium]
MATIPRALFTVVLALLILSRPAPVLSAQGGLPMIPDLRSSSRVGIGYVVSAPRELVGFSALGLTPKLFGGAGLYADVKFTHKSPADNPYFVDGLSPQEVEATFGDPSFEGESVWFSANLALVYAVTRDLGLYLGGGYSKEQHYREYYDDTQSRGFEGFYWVLDEAASGNRINALGGMLMRAARHLVIQVGMESRPLGGTVGLMLTLPF